MFLTRFVYKDEYGDIWGMAHNDCDDLILEDTILEYGEFLLIPEPYPDNTEAFFTPSGLKKHSHLIELWVERCELNNHEVIKIEREKSELNIAYEDNDQVLSLL